MKYKDLKEMTFKEWDGKPFLAIVADNDETEIYSLDEESLTGRRRPPVVSGYDDRRWLCKDSGLHWKHAYSLEWNKKPKKRMTNRQLAKWLAKGNGQWRHMDTDVINVHTEFHYGVGIDDEELKGNIRVRKFDSKEWIEPTTDLLEDC